MPHTPTKAPKGGGETEAKLNSLQLRRDYAKKVPTPIPKGPNKEGKKTKEESNSWERRKNYASLVKTREEAPAKAKSGGSSGKMSQAKMSTGPATASGATPTLKKKASPTTAENPKPSGKVTMMVSKPKVFSQEGKTRKPSQNPYPGDAKEKAMASDRARNRKQCALKIEEESSHGKNNVDNSVKKEKRSSHPKGDGLVRANQSNRLNNRLRQKTAPSKATTKVTREGAALKFGAPPNIKKPPVGKSSPIMTKEEPQKEISKMRSRLRDIEREKARLDQEMKKGRAETCRLKEKLRRISKEIEALKPDTLTSIKPPVGKPSSIMREITKEMAQEEMLMVRSVLLKADAKAKGEEESLKAERARVESLLKKREKDGESIEESATLKPGAFPLSGTNTKLNLPLTRLFLVKEDEESGCFDASVDQTVQNKPENIKRGQTVYRKPIVKSTVPGFRETLRNPRWMQIYSSRIMKRVYDIYAPKIRQCTRNTTRK